MKKYAFTLIELLIVVAIIAILAAIAVPNFIDAQTRAKVARAKADMRSIDTALEIYMNDNNQYALYVPASNGNNPLYYVPWSQRLIPLTTPVPFLSTLPHDAFKHATNFGRGVENTNDPDVRSYVYSRGDQHMIPEKCQESGAKKKYVILSSGPDNNVESNSYWSIDEIVNLFESHHGGRYDPSNGTVSRGDIFRWSGSVTIN